ncbi:MAG TPA: hypothetical protein VK446_07630 [Methylocystis sp.]|nr:hypothetical protein [Methylocystis sp.]
MKMFARMLLGVGAILTACGAAGEPAARGTTARGTWPDGFVVRLEALALIETLNADLLASRSATATLEEWCADHRMAKEPKIVARRLGGAEKPASPETRRRLQLEDDDPVKYRRVQLVCGDHVLSEADNWYAPGRLTEEMNRQLDETQTPFGKVVQSLHPSRRTFEAKLLWSPLPSGWETKAPEIGAAAEPPVIPHALFAHRALLYAEDQRPISEVDETYLGGVLEFELAQPQWSGMSDENASMTANSRP